MRTSIADEAVMRGERMVIPKGERGVYLMVRQEREEGVFSELLLMVDINE